MMLQRVLAGGMVPVTDRIFLDQLSWVMPSHPDAAVGLAACVGGRTRSTRRAQLVFHTSNHEVPDYLGRSRIRSCTHELPQGLEGHCNRGCQPRPMVRST